MTELEEVKEELRKLSAQVSLLGNGKLPEPILLTEDHRRMYIADLVGGVENAVFERWNRRLFWAGLLWGVLTVAVPVSSLLRVDGLAKRAASSKATEEVNDIIQNRSREFVKLQETAKAADRAVTQAHRSSGVANLLIKDTNDRLIVLYQKFSSANTAVTDLEEKARVSATKAAEAQRSAERSQKSLGKSLRDTSAALSSFRPGNDQVKLLTRLIENQGATFESTTMQVSARLKGLEAKPYDRRLAQIEARLNILGVSRALDALAKGFVRIDNDTICLMQGKRAIATLARSASAGALNLKHANGRMFFEVRSAPDVGGKECLFRFGHGTKFHAFNGQEIQPAGMR